MKRLIFNVFLTSKQSELLALELTDEEIRALIDKAIDKAIDMRIEQVNTDVESEGESA